MATPIPTPNNLGPVDDICQDNAHRAGASNTQESEGNPMVSAKSAARSATVKAIESRLAAESGRYLLVHRNVQTLSTTGLAELVAEIVADATAALECERDSLAWDLADVLSGRRPVSSVGAMFTEHDELGGGR